jgi:hypothetical protein
VPGSTAQRDRIYSNLSGILVYGISFLFNSVWAGKGHLKTLGDPTPKYQRHFTYVRTCVGSK